MKKEWVNNPELTTIKSGYPGNLKINGLFVYGTEPENLPYATLARWVFTPNPQRAEKKKDRFAPKVISDGKFLQKEKDQIVWVGHSTIYMQLNGSKILTDPIFRGLGPFPNRRTKLPCDPNDLLNLDYILLSHGHRDHLDVDSLKLLARNNPDCKVLCPLGFFNLVKSCGFTKVEEAGWYQQYQTIGIDICFLPAKHWNRRSINDYNIELWGSFWIRCGEMNIYFAGDTALGPHFEAIKEQCGSPDICLVPVGAYKPKFVMEWAHTSPEEAIEAFHILGGKNFIPIHYGTFDLSDEPPGEPVRILKQMEKENKINGRLVFPSIGESINI